MNDYKTYMDKVALSQAQHAQIMAALTGIRPVSRNNHYVKRYAALAACLALVCTAAWGLWRGGSLPQPPSPAPDAALPAPTAQPNAQVYSDPADPGDSFPVEGRPGGADQPPAVHIPYVATPAPTQQDQYVVPLDPRPNATPPLEADMDKVLPYDITDLTLEACRAEPVLGPHLPQSLPGRFAFESGSRSDGVLSALWTHGMEEIQVCLSRPDRAPAAMDTSDPSRYDVRLYAIPWCDSVPQEVLEGGFEDPVFRYEDLTAEVIAARALSGAGDSGDTAGDRFSFSVLYDDGVVARYSMKGVTADEAAVLLLG